MFNVQGVGKLTSLLKCISKYRVGLECECTIKMMIIIF